MNTILITGNTYPVKDKLKTLGAKWNAEKKGWEVPSDKANEAQALVAGVIAQSRSQRSYPKKCQVCGCVERRNSRGYVENRIYRSGECQDCFEERKMGY